MAQPASNESRTNRQRTPGQATRSGATGNSAKDSMYAMGLSSKDWLCRGNKSEDEVFTFLIDSYRMRVEDESNFRGQISGSYNGGDPVPEFKKFLGLAEANNGILPRWWTAEKRDACVAKGSAKSGWANLYSAMEKSDIQEHYGDGQMPMKLRMLAEEITGSYIMDTSAK